MFPSLRGWIRAAPQDAAECALIGDLVTDQTKRELFDRLTSHLTVRADEVEQALLQRKAGT